LISQSDLQSEIYFSLIYRNWRMREQPLSTWRHLHRFRRQIQVHVPAWLHRSQLRNRLYICVWFTQDIKINEVKRIIKSYKLIPISFCRWSKHAFCTVVTIDLENLRAYNLKNVVLNATKFVIKNVNSTVQRSAV
jgi:hypothetical protein